MPTQPKHEPGDLVVAYRMANGTPVYDVGWKPPRLPPHEEGFPYDPRAPRTPYTAVIGVGSVTLRPS